MSSSSSPTSTLARIALSPSVRELLRKVRFRLRRDAVASGLLAAICFCVLTFWITTTLDVSWFRLQRLELPVGLRSILLAMLLPALIWFLAARVLFPLFRRIGDLDIALLLERRFPQFQDRLITSVESSRGIPVDGPMARPMLERSASEAEQLSQSVAAGDVFNASVLRRLSMWTGGLCIVTAVVIAAQPHLLTRWWNAFVRCEETYFQRTTDLSMVVISQPGDRRIAFEWTEESLLYRHPRGADLELEMSVPDGGPEDGLAWVVPDRVRVDVIRSDGSRSRTYVAATASSDRTFRFVVTRLQESIEVELLAGDYRTRVPYRVAVVNPPGLDAIRLTCNYPDYTGWNQLRETAVIVTGSEVQLPIGTTFALTALSSKPLQAVRIISDQFELSGDREASRIIWRDRGDAHSVAQPLLSGDGKSLTAQFRITPPTVDGSEPPPSALSPTGAAIPEIPFSTTLRFFLHDEDDVMSVSPETLRVQGVPDKPPVVVAQMTGIDNAITRLAKVPVAGRIRDDYGLKSSGFEFLVDDESTWRPRPFRKSSDVGATDFELQRSETEPFEVFDVQSLELSEGQTLTMSVVAADSNVFPGPGLTRSDPLLFRVVSIEELLSLLYTREIALRGRFEEIIRQLEEVETDLQFHQDVAGRVDQQGAASAPEDRASLNTCASRSGNSLRRQTNELNAVIEGFEEVVKQLINNAIPPQQLAENMRLTIVDPLKAASGEMMTSADRAVSAFRVAAQDGQQVEELVRLSQNEVGSVIVSLKLILENVRDMAEFHEALRDLKAILDEQQKNLEQTRKLQKNQLIDDILK